MKNLSEIRKERKDVLAYCRRHHGKLGIGKSCLHCRFFGRTGWRKRRHRKGVILWIIRGMPF